MIEVTHVRIDPVDSEDSRLLAFARIEDAIVRAYAAVRKGRAESKVAMEVGG